MQQSPFHSPHPCSQHRMDERHWAAGPTGLNRQGQVQQGLSNAVQRLGCRHHVIACIVILTIAPAQGRTNSRKACSITRLHCTGMYNQEGSHGLAERDGGGRCQLRGGRQGLGGRHLRLVCGLCRVQDLCQGLLGVLQPPESKLTGLHFRAKTITGLKIRTHRTSNAAYLSAEL